MCYNCGAIPYVYNGCIAGNVTTYCYLFGKPIPYLLGMTLFMGFYLFIFLLILFLIVYYIILIRNYFKLRKKKHKKKKWVELSRF